MDPRKRPPNQSPTGQSSTKKPRTDEFPGRPGMPSRTSSTTNIGEPHRRQNAPSSPPTSTPLARQPPVPGSTRPNGLGISHSSATNVTPNQGVAGGSSDNSQLASSVDQNQPPQVITRINGTDPRGRKGSGDANPDLSVPIQGNSVVSNGASAVESALSCFAAIITKLNSLEAEKRAAEERVRAKVAGCQEVEKLGMYVRVKEEREAALAAAQDKLKRIDAAIASTIVSQDSINKHLSSVIGNTGVPATCTKVHRQPNSRTDNEAEERNKKLSYQVQTLKQELDDFKDDLRPLTNRLPKGSNGTYEWGIHSETKRKVSDLEDENVKTKRDLKYLEANYKSLSNECKSLRSECKSLRSEIAAVSTLKTTTAGLKSDLSDMSKKHDQKSSLLNQEIGKLWATVTAQNHKVLEALELATTSTTETPMTTDMTVKDILKTQELVAAELESRIGPAVDDALQTLFKKLASSISDKIEQVFVGKLMDRVDERLRPAIEKTDKLEDQINTRSPKNHLAQPELDKIVSEVTELVQSKLDGLSEKICGAIETTNELKEQLKAETKKTDLAQQELNKMLSKLYERTRSIPELNGLSVRTNKLEDQIMQQSPQNDLTQPMLDKILSQILERIAPEISNTVGVRIKQASDELEPRLSAVETGIGQTNQKLKDQHQNLLEVATEIADSIAPLRQEVKDTNASIAAVGKNLEEARNIVTDHTKALHIQGNALTMFEHSLIRFSSDQAKSRTGSSTASPTPQIAPPVQLGVEHRGTVQASPRAVGVAHSSHPPSPQIGTTPNLIAGEQSLSKIKELETTAAIHRHAIDEIKQRLNNITTESMSRAILSQIIARYPILDMQTVRNELDRLDSSVIAQNQVTASTAKQLNILQNEHLTPALTSFNHLHGTFYGTENSEGVMQRIGKIENNIHEVLSRSLAEPPEPKQPSEELIKSHIDETLQVPIANIRADIQKFYCKFDVDLNGTETSEGLLQRINRIERFEERITKSEGDIEQVSEKLLATFPEPQRLHELIRSQVQETLKTPIAEIKADIEPLKAPMTQLRADVDNITGISNHFLNDTNRRIGSLEDSVILLEKSQAQTPTPQKWVEMIKVEVQQHLCEQVATLVADLNVLRNNANTAICLLNGIENSEGVVKRVEKIESDLLEKSRAGPPELQQQQPPENLIRLQILEEIEVKAQEFKVDATELRDWFKTEVENVRKDLEAKVEEVQDHGDAEVKNSLEQSNRIFEGIDSHLERHDYLHSMMEERYGDLETAVSNIKVQLGYNRRIDLPDVALKHGESTLIADIKGKMRTFAGFLQTSESTQRQQKTLIDELLQRTMDVIPDDFRIRGTGQERLRIQQSSEPKGIRATNEDFQTTSPRRPQQERLRNLSLSSPSKETWERTANSQTSPRGYDQRQDANNRQSMYIGRTRLTTLRSKPANGPHYYGHGAERGSIPLSSDED